MNKIAIFASGNGTNMEAIANYIAEHPDSMCEVTCVLCDRKDAYVMTRAHNHQIPAHYLTRNEWKDEKYVLDILRAHEVDVIVLAGYLSLVPEYLLRAFPSRILNIHPALLPKYGGRGMYGMNVHTAVKNAGEKESGITIHEIDHEFDKGKTIFQASVELSEEDTPEDIANKVHTLEYRHFPEVVVRWTNSKR